jgi:hypothetical protein
MKIYQMKLLFEVTPFYNAECEKFIPSLDECKAHFLCFYSEYKRMEQFTADGYNNRFANLIAFSTNSGKLVKALSTDEYEALGKEFNRLNDYYKLLLIAVRRVHEYWLNDLLPKETKTKKRKTVKQNAL